MGSVPQTADGILAGGKVNLPVKMLLLSAALNSDSALPLGKVTTKALFSHTLLIQL